MALASLDEHLARFSFARMWPVALAVGISTILLGIIAIAWPDITVGAVATIFGLQLAAFGAYRTVAAFTQEGESHRMRHLMVGLIAIGVGVLCLGGLFDTAAGLALALGLSWILIGVLDVAGAVFDPTAENRMLRMVFGGLSLLVGLIVVSTPYDVAVAVARTLGIWLLAQGGLEVAIALGLRRVDKRPSTTRTATLPSPEPAPVGPS